MSRLLARRGWLAVALLLPLILSPRAASAQADADRTAIQQVIRSQLDAFQHDDARGAFGFATPTLQAEFGTPETFMRMVRTAYAPVYRPQSVAFTALVPAPTGVVQTVTLVGPDGLSYSADYTMQKQPNGTWRIGGCILTKSNQVNA